MKKFQFKLQAVLNHTECEEEQRKLELAQLHFKKQQAELELERLVLARMRSREKLTAQQSGTLDMEEINSLREHIEQLSAQVEQQRQQVEALEVEVAAKTEEVLQAMKKRQMLEKLREREEQEYNLAANRLEEKLLDDLIGPRYGSKVL